MNVGDCVMVRTEKSSISFIFFFFSFLFFEGGIIFSHKGFFFFFFFHMCCTHTPTEPHVDFRPGLKITNTAPDRGMQGNPG